MAFQYINLCGPSEVRSVHFPKVDDIEWIYHTYKFTNLFLDEMFLDKITISLESFSKLYTDFRYKNQANHKLYLKFYDSIKRSDITSWLNACEACSPLGIINKDDIGCINLKESTTNTRICYVKHNITPETNVYIRLGIPVEFKDTITIGTINVS
jgi:hypothetical protein